MLALNDWRMQILGMNISVLRNETTMLPIALSISTTKEN